MASLKQSLKQILVNKQHKLYEKEVASRNLTYSGWIIKREEKVEIEQQKDGINIKYLKIEQIPHSDELNKGKNEGNNSKRTNGNDNVSPEETYGQRYEQLIEVYNKNSPGQGGKTLININASDFYRDIEYHARNTIADVILISLYRGECNQIAYPLIGRVFAENENVVLVYGDEDSKRSQKRENPWFKPDWSPDRFLSGFYFGGLVAVRTSALQKTYMRCKESGLFKNEEAKNAHREFLYLLLYEMLKEHNAFSRQYAFSKHNAFSKHIAFSKGDTSSAGPVYHIPQVLFHSYENGYEQIKGLRLPPESFLREREAGKPKADAPRPVGQKVEESAVVGSKVDERKAEGSKTGEPEKNVVSVIVPSKDNPDVLFHCLDSLFQKTCSEYPFEIILVDNGSGEENRKRISDRVSRLNEEWTGEGKNISFMGCTYLYHPMTFNFSGMCNLGAAKAQGSLLLFLNDDMEIIQPDWMDLMAGKAVLPYAGAVGAKLLYPDSDIIQHAGITNLRVGPAHKLQFLHDAEDHYFGMNRGVHNMMAVTGACLMISRKVFEEAGGFCQELAVAFNDVDLCYTIHEMGYYNIERNDVVLFHHESLSRGKDGDSPEKQQRLLRERDILYDRHDDLYGKDPYYNPGLVTDMLQTEYLPAYHYQVTLDMPWSEPVPFGEKVRRAREDKCLVVGMECAMDIYKWRYGGLPKKGRIKGRPEDMGYYFQGYSFIIGSDNACYKKTLLLKNRDSEKIFSLSVENRYRKDIKDNLKDQVNVELTGFVARMQWGKIPEGVYQLGMLAEDKCSTQKLVNWSNWVLEVAGTETSAG